MPIDSRAKGIRGELAFCKLCKEHGFEDVRRSQQFCGNTGQAADVVGLPYLHVEVKNVEKLNVRESVRQAVRDAKAEGKGNMPFVAWKKNGQPWEMIMRADVFFELYEGYLFMQNAIGDGLETRKNRGDLG
ncbi:hypothetical protein [Anaerovibrio sp. RM50]|uniref:hypothetical protein n=1 Tax=Anaerovibrio sp. RM50 TaxID=1200557 RepID=UPI0018DC23F8|nr:hypothetical protein [Anaerovibrio sp. RM50]